ncbi:hypothetical protein MRB53_010368 [Persea americana]|uniref:Uncharacterized protein n=1 Tax=Persea americana TaxID=3435 RepID=A0ACC2LRI3_PERAE|nr:hypothetical protein MRB53_010368 [Persea americana]
MYLPCPGQTRYPRDRDSRLSLRYYQPGPGQTKHPRDRDLSRTSEDFLLPGVFVGAIARGYTVLLLHEEIEGHLETLYSYLKIVVRRLMAETKSPGLEEGALAAATSERPSRLRVGVSFKQLARVVFPLPSSFA